MTDEEAAKEKKDNLISEDLELITETEKEDLIMDNDVLVDMLENELDKDHLTDE